MDGGKRQQWALQVEWKIGTWHQSGKEQDSFQDKASNALLPLFSQSEF